VTHHAQSATSPAHIRFPGQQSAFPLCSLALSASPDLSLSHCFRSHLHLRTYACPDPDPGSRSVDFEFEFDPFHI